MGRILVNDDELFNAIDYLILSDDPKSEWHAMQLFIYASRSLKEEFRDYEVYSKKVIDDYGTITNETN